MNVKHILVATDLSEETLRCCAPGVTDLASALGARITLLHVVGTLAAIPHGAPFAPALEQPPAQNEIESARQRLEERKAAYGAGVEITTDVISGGDIAEEIVQYAEANDADMIAVATHGRTGFRHLVLGSVAEGVIRRSRVPVVVFPRPKS